MVSGADGDSVDFEISVPGYRIVRRIGAGAFATVYEAIQEDVEAPVALKVLTVDPTDAGLRDRFTRECRSMGRLRDRRGVVPVYQAAFSTDGHPVIVMAYMPGGTLLDRLDREGVLSGAEVASIGATLARALAAAHELGIHHRDIKPENILLDRNGEPALSDLGIATVDGFLAGTRTQASLTPAHAPPERYLSHEPQELVAGDIYSLSSTLYQLLTGHPPFGSTSEGGIAALINRIVNDAPDRISRDDVSPELADAILQGLAKSPSDRPSTAADFAVMLDPNHESPNSTLSEPTSVRTSWDEVPIPPPSPDTPDMSSAPHADKETPKDLTVRRESDVEPATYFSTPPPRRLHVKALVAAGIVGAVAISASGIALALGVVDVPFLPDPPPSTTTIAQPPTTATTKPEPTPTPEPEPTPTTEPEPTPTTEPEPTPTTEPEPTATTEPLPPTTRERGPKNPPTTTPTPPTLPPDLWSSWTVNQRWVDPLGLAYVSVGSSANTVADRVERWDGRSHEIAAGGNGIGAQQNQLSKPLGVTLDSDGSLYIADSGNHRVQKWAFGAEEGETVAGGNSMGSGKNQLSYPSDVAVDGSGNIYVADAGNHRIQKWAPGAWVGETVAGNSLGKPGTALNQLNGPRGIALDEDGNLFVADSGNNRVLRFSPDSQSGELIAGKPGELKTPSGVAVDAGGKLYIADTGNNRILLWDLSDLTGTPIAGNQTPLVQPAGITVDKNGNVYIAERSNCRVTRWAANQKTKQVAAYTCSTSTSTSTSTTTGVRP